MNTNRAPCNICVRYEHQLNSAVTVEAKMRHDSNEYKFREYR